MLKQLTKSLKKNKPNILTDCILQSCIIIVLFFIVLLLMLFFYMTTIVTDYIIKIDF